MKVLLGLGNPGKEYEHTRHNAGWWLVDHLAERWSFDGWKKDGQSKVAQGHLPGVRETVRLVKPQTYMNLSGEAVACLLARYEPADPGEKLIVISDDLALPFGKIRIRARGSAGGHNGLKSIIGAIATYEFTRLRIGIQPEHPISDSKRFVLDTFTGASRTAVEDILQKSADALRAILSDGVLKAMSTYNSES